MVEELPSRKSDVHPQHGVGVSEVLIAPLGLPPSMDHNVLSTGHAITMQPVRGCRRKGCFLTLSVA